MAEIMTMATEEVGIIEYGAKYNIQWSIQDTRRFAAFSSQTEKLCDTYPA